MISILFRIIPEYLQYIKKFPEKKQKYYTNVGKIWKIIHFNLESRFHNGDTYCIIYKNFYIVVLLP